jgi:glycosyltransferase involved in cell wall biosynthesis
MQSNRQPRVLWLTNLPAPYRFPIWSRMAERLDIKVAFLLGEENWRNWRAPEGYGWRHEFLNLKSINIKEYDVIPSARGASRLIRNVDVLVLGGWETPFYVRAFYLAKKRNIRVIQFYESTESSHRVKNFFIRKFRSWMFAQAELIVTIGSDSTEAVVAMGIDSERIVTLFNPVDVEWFFSSTKELRGVPTSGHHYLYVGQLIERKNIASVISSFARICRPDDTLTIVGEGPLARELKKLAESLGISKSVLFVGQKSQEDLARIYAKSETLILASKNEVWGLVVNEALASGLHVVVADQCGVAEFVHLMRGVYICSTDQLSIEKAMQDSSSQWAGYIQNPQILNFTPNKFADEMIELCMKKYQQL